MVLLKEIVDKRQTQVSCMCGKIDVKLTHKGVRPVKKMELI